MPKISIIIPTFNESVNISILIERISICLSHINKEVIVVDDNSPDKTWEVARNLSKTYPWVRVIRRMTEKGLSSAVLNGFEQAEGEILAVMDADLQHDENALPFFLNEFEMGAEIVVGSRKVEGGGIEDWSSARKFVSWVATFMAQIALTCPVSDPMSGFFAIKRELYAKYKSEINPRGFKILLEFLARAQKVKISEVGYTFKGRVHGESKLSSSVIYDYIHALYELSIGKYIPILFIKYGIVGLLGLIIATCVLIFSENLLNLSDFWALAVSIEVSILSNFLFNNIWTFKKQKLIGLHKFIRGIITFHAICLGGAFINHSIALKLIGLGFYIVWANAVGYLVAAIWNYLINVNITWKNS